MAKKITAYKTSDGQLFDDKTKAEAYENRLGLAEDVNEFVGLHFSDDEDNEDVSGILIEHAPELYLILKHYLGKTASNEQD